MPLDSKRIRNICNSVFSEDTAFFFCLALLTTFLVFTGFIANWVVNPQRLAHISFWPGLHGVLSATWYLLLLNQLRLSMAGQIATHRLLGKFSAWLVIGILISGVIMVLGLYERLVDIGMFDPNDAIARTRTGGLIGGTFLQWSIFATLFLLGVINVKNPAHHKRFMLAASIQMMPEGLNRLIHLIGIPGYFMLLIMLLMYALIIFYDWKQKARIYWSTLVSLALFGCLSAAIYSVFRAQFWGDWVTKMLT